MILADEALLFVRPGGAASALGGHLTLDLYLTRECGSNGLSSTTRLCHPLGL